MPDVDFGNIIRVPMNQIWAHEERHFTPWLAQNISKLGDALGGLQLEVEQTEVYAGTFQLDIKAIEVGTNRIAVIENQIYKTDHKHLGQLITYAAYFKAEIIVWVSQEVTEEHRAAIDWLNNNTTEKLAFYAIEADIIKIDDSKPALNFKLKAFPNTWQKTSGGITIPNTETNERYREFFQKLIDELREKYHFTNARMGQPQSWYSFVSGVKGLVYSCSFARGSKVRSEIYIDTSDKNINKLILTLFKQNRKDYEFKFGQTLEWEELPTRRASRIAIYRDGDIFSDVDTIEDIRQWCINQLIKLKDVFGNDLGIISQKAINTQINDFHIDDESKPID